ncbi:MAG TPA: glycerol-3-phosphate acyltransferase [Nitrospirae bacterium]|nr:glycerol-3-phosphate acyltransferase [Nitrospirota bacterium]
MSDTVTLPFPVFVALCVLAVWAVLGSLFIPSVRWFLRRSARHVLDELNTHLQLKIQPFKLTMRQVLIDRLVYDPEVLKAVDAHADKSGHSREEVMARVNVYAREIVPSFNTYAYFRLGYALARMTVNFLYRVRLGYSDEEGLSKVDPNASVVFIMNHRSNVDYILVAYLAASRSALSYAVGEWARIWPLQTLIKSMGAYFIRRNSGDTLYRKVLARYVAMATAGGVVQAVYPEGRLTRDGKLQPLKLGLLGYILAGYDPDDGRDLVFIPVGVNYDRTLEDRSLVRRLDPGLERKSGLYALKVTVKFILHNFILMFKRRWYRFGYAGVNFGTPISMTEYIKEKNVNFRKLEKEEFHREVSLFGGKLIKAVGDVIPALPVSLVATAFLKNENRRLSELELKAEVYGLMLKLDSAGAHIHIPREDQEYAVTVGLRMLKLRRFVLEKEGLYAVNPDERVLLEYYANAIGHLFD